jgi:hypothetical protein
MVPAEKLRRTKSILSSALSLRDIAKIPTSDVKLTNATLTAA